MRKVLFLCSGNYYRSRFAEMLFNTIAAKRGIAWRADSRGLACDRPNQNVGPLSVHAVQGLQSRGIAHDPERWPKQVSEHDLASAALVIAVKEAEHRAMLTARHPAWKDRVEYWHIDDLDCAGPEEALGKLEEHVVRLASRLAHEDTQPPRSAA